jgi:hypothetical protein
LTTVCIWEIDHGHYLCMVEAVPHEARQFENWEQSWKVVDKFNNA